MISRLGPILGVAILSAALACNAMAADPKRAEGYLNDAAKSLQKGDIKAAAIQLKNAVQSDPDNGRARYELGAIQLGLGDYLSAEKELRAAIERNYDRDNIAPGLGPTLLRLNK